MHRFLERGSFHLYCNRSTDPGHLPSLESDAINLYDRRRNFPRCEPARALALHALFSPPTPYQRHRETITVTFSLAKIDPLSHRAGFTRFESVYRNPGDSFRGEGHRPVSSRFTFHAGPTGHSRQATLRAISALFLLIGCQKVTIAAGALPSTVTLGVYSPDHDTEHHRHPFASTAPTLLNTLPYACAGP